MNRKIPFVVGEYYHTYNKTVFGINEFSDRDNAYKLAQTFLLANSTTSSQAFDYLRNDRHPMLKNAIEIKNSGEKLTDILCYVIMPNHYHLLLREIKEGGITDFLRRSSTSIAKYINTKKETRGPLFEGNFKSKHIDSNTYLLHLSLYIHLNPLDFITNNNWRENKMEDWGNIFKKLTDYRWSSLRSYLNDNDTASTSDFDAIISGEKIIKNQFNDLGNDNDYGNYGNFLKEWATGLGETNNDNI